MANETVSSVSSIYNTTSKVFIANGSRTSNISQSTSLLSTASVATLGLLFVLMFLVSILGNTIVCYIVYQKPAMRSAINILLATLAMADVLTAALCMPFAIISLIAQRWIFGDEFCQINAILFSFLVTEGTFVLLTISVDRFMIIVQRKDTLTPRKAKMYIVVSWISSFAVVLPPIFGWGKYGYELGQIQCSLEWPSRNAVDLSYGLFFYISTCSIPLLLMGYCFGSILRTVRRNSTRIQNHPPVPGGVMTKMHRPGKMNIDYSFKTRAFTTILILFILFLMCGLPYTVIRFHLLFKGYADSLSYAGDIVVLLIAYLNSTLKPIIYYVRISKFREACLDIMPSWCHVPHCLPGRTMRRIRPHVVYEVDKKFVTSAL